MNNLVSIGLPIYKRLEHLPTILRIVASQDYPCIELIVSDNGVNGEKVANIVKTHYPRPYRFRQNPETVSMGKHFNQLIQEASGDYFILLMDDDEISSNYVSELVAQIEAYPQASIAISRQETIDENGVVVRKCKEALPSIMSGPDFIQAMWGHNEFNYEIVDSFLAKTEELKACGGYPDFPRGNHIENALVVKLSLKSSIVFCSKCVFRWRSVGSSYAWSQSIEEFAVGTRKFLEFLNHDPRTCQFAVENPSKWKEVKRCLVRMAWQSYLLRWRELYNERLSRLQWTKAAFAMPLIPDYYREVSAVFRNCVKANLKRSILGSFQVARK
jgi:glycosyltransferase involved in cell wall biosynthesis